MLRIDIVSLFPNMFKGFLEDSIIKRAVEKELACINIHNLRNYGIARKNKKQVDDAPFGGGAGMVLRIEPILKCFEFLQEQQTYDEIIFLTPDGEKLNQNIVNQLSLKKNILLLAGRYKGIDQRIRDNYISREISIGDYVLTGGELAAAVVVDSVVRLIPGVLSDESSALSDSFQGNILDAPVYTQPRDYKGMKVPEILLSGNHKKIEEWRLKKSLEKTKKRRPDL